MLRIPRKIRIAELKLPGLINSKSEKVLLMGSFPFYFEWKNIPVNQSQESNGRKKQ
jgi:hypothetical protein